MKNYYNNLFLQRKKKVARNKGQAITDYAATLAFVAVIISIVFSFGPKKLGTAVQQAFSSVTQQLTNLENESSS